MCTPTNTWTPVRALKRPSSHLRRPSSASFPMRTSTRRTTPTRSSLDDRWVQGPWGQQRPILRHRRLASSRCLRDVLEDVSPPERSRPGSLLHGPRPQLGRPTQIDGSELELLKDYDQHMFGGKRMTSSWPNPLQIIQQTVKLINNSVLGINDGKIYDEGLMSSWSAPKKKTNSVILSPAQPLQEPTSSTMILQQSRCIRFV